MTLGIEPAFGPVNEVALLEIAQAYDDHVASRFGVYFGCDERAQLFDRPMSIAMLPHSCRSGIQAMRLVSAGIIDQKLAVEFLDDHAVGVRDWPYVILRL